LKALLYSLAYIKHGGHPWVLVGDVVREDGKTFTYKYDTGPFGRVYDTYLNIKLSHSLEVKNLTVIPLSEYNK
jgi:hypothetical protein